MTESESDLLAESFDEIRARAEACDANAQLTLGAMYATGRGVEKGYTKAALWFQLHSTMLHAGL